jgi:hypothetical protein
MSRHSTCAHAVLARKQALKPLVSPPRSSSLVRARTHVYACRDILTHVCVCARARACACVRVVCVRACASDGYFGDYLRGARGDGGPGRLHICPQGAAPERNGSSLRCVEVDGWVGRGRYNVGVGGWVEGGRYNAGVSRDASDGL